MTQIFDKKNVSLTIDRNHYALKLRWVMRSFWNVGEKLHIIRLNEVKKTFRARRAIRRNTQICSTYPYR